MKTLEYFLEQDKEWFRNSNAFHWAMKNGDYDIAYVVCEENDEHQRVFRSLCFTLDDAFDSACALAKQLEQYSDFIVLNWRDTNAFYEWKETQEEWWEYTRIQIMPNGSPAFTVGLYGKMKPYEGENNE